MQLPRKRSRRIAPELCNRQVSLWAKKGNGTSSGFFSAAANRALIGAGSGCILSEGRVFRPNRESRMSKSVSETLWTVPLVLVGLVVLLGILRLVISNWSYLFLTIVVAVGGYYILQAVSSDRK